MPRWARPLALVALAFATACGPSSTRAPGEQPGDGAAESADSSASEAAPALVASNGVSIPPRDPRDSCGALGLALAACRAGDVCASIDCPCGGSNLITSTCPGMCLTNLDCDAWCALDPDVALLAAIRCENGGLCRADQECRVGARCFRAPGETLGSCSTGELGDDCLTDADCSAPGGCVADQNRQRSCWSGGPGQGCNRDEQCAAGKCLLQAGKFRGVCTDGRNNQFCWADADCRPGLKCMHGPVDAVCSDGANESLCATDADCQPTFTCVDSQFSITGRRCTSGGTGAACQTDADCHGGFCIQEIAPVCDTGAVGAKCNQSQQCLSHFCVGGTCTAGAFGDPCRLDVDCQSQKCGANGDLSTCTVKGP